MSFSLYYRKSISTVSGQVQSNIIYRELEGEAFHLEHDLVVFADASGGGGRPVGAANLAGLMWITRDDSPSDGSGFEVKGRFNANGEQSCLNASGAEAFFTEGGFAVFYDDPARAGRQVLAVRCSEVDFIRRV